MKRTKNIKIPDLILTSDWHLREDTPICRTDDFWEAQWNKVTQVMRLQERYECPIAHAGDLFHYWKSSPYLLSRSIEELSPLGYSDENKKFYSVVGQHEIPQHNINLIEKSGTNVLWECNIIELPGMYGINNSGFFGSKTPADLSDFITEDLDNEGNLLSEEDRIKPFIGKGVGIWHKFVWDGKHWPWPECPEMTAKEVLKKHPDFDLIVTGDYHKPFTYEYKGRLLVNPGCLTRQVADYADHRPRVYLWYAETNTVEPHYLDISDGVVSREHIEKKEEIDKRIEAFISRLSDDWETVTSFDENLKRFMSSNRIRKEVTELVYKAIDNN